MQEKDFNPRSRKASTTDRIRHYDSAVISIHEAARLRHVRSLRGLPCHAISIHEAARLRLQPTVTKLADNIFQSTKPQGFDAYVDHGIKLGIISIHEAARLRQQKHPKKNLISQNNLYTYYNIPTHNNYILIILNLFTIKSTIFQVRISRDFHVHFLFAPNNSIIKYHH